MNKKERILITGGAGFIGANVVEYLLDKDEYKITVYDNLSVGSKENLEQAISHSTQKDAVEFIRGDILDNVKLNEVIRGHNVVIHLAAHTKVIESIVEPQENFKTNVIGTFNLLEASRKNKIEKFIFASSNAAVGEQKPPINEKMVSKPLSPYGATKLYGEALCSAYFNSYGLKTVSLRFANAYGPYSEHKNSVVATFIKRAKQAKPLEIYGDGNQTRDFIYASDICQAVYLCLTDYLSTSPWGEVFQIATAAQTKIIDLAGAIKDLALSSGFKPLQIVFKNQRKGEIRKNHSDIKKAKKMLGFKPKIKLREGLKSLINQFPTKVGQPSAETN